MHRALGLIAALCLALTACSGVRAQCDMSDHSNCLGYIHNGTTTGQEVKLGGLDAYLSIPSRGGVAPLVLLYTDIYGWELPNIRLWSDALAKDGYVAVVPDFFKNNSWTPARAAAGETTATWLASYSDAQILNETRAVVADLRAKQAQYSISLGKVGTEGFCWGGKYVVLSLGTSKIASAGVVYHGSRITADLVSAITAPVLFQQSDPALDRNLNQTVYDEFAQILAAKNASGIPTGIEFYANQPHGYALRGDSNDTATVNAAAQAYEKGSAWLRKYLA